MPVASFRTVEVSNPVFEADGLRFLTIKTPNLQGRGDVCVFIPKLEGLLRELPIYLLLHGVYGSAWAWALKGGVHITAQRMMERGEIAPAIVAMPSDGLWGDGSFYFSHHGKNFDRWIVDDVPLAIRENVPQAGYDAPLCIGGLSMGGYGALRLGALHPEKITAVSGHSSITKLEQLTAFVEEPLADYVRFAEHPDLIDILKNGRGIMPPFRFDCGQQDSLLAANQILHRQLVASEIRHEYEEFSGGHEWVYWQKHVEKTLFFFDRQASGEISR